MKAKLIKNESGLVMIVAMAILIMTALIGMMMISTSSEDVTISGNVRNSTRAFYAAEAGLALARTRLWTDYVNGRMTNPPKAAGEVGNRASYVAYLDSMGLVDRSQMVVTSNWVMDGGQTIDSVVVVRNDLMGSTDLNVQAIGHDQDNAVQSIRALYRVEGDLFKGLDFAILAKNVNCIMCHATVDNVDRVYNTDAAKAGTFDRVKVASLESMLIRTTSAQSYVAGTIYTRGVVTDKSGNVITDLSPSGQGVEGYAIDATTGTIQEPMNTTKLTNTTGSPLPQNGNLYLNYPTTKSEMTDGELPSEFPPPFPDDNGNKIVDDAEFAATASGSKGTISGGVIYSVPSGGTFNKATLPKTGNTKSVSQSHNGNLVLVGTAADPIVLNGDIAVDGDVILQGVVKGAGQILARGNVYVTGDVTYNDGNVSGNRTFGVAGDGTRNALSLAAGGNIMMGDYLTPKKGDINDVTQIDPGNLSANETFSFTMSEITLFNRGEWTKTQPVLPDVNGNMVANATYDPTYKPRYYTMNAGDPVYIYNKSSGGKGTYWDPTTKSWQGKEHVSSYDLNMLTKLDPGNVQLLNAKMVPLSSTKGWISPATLKSLWMADEASRPAGSPFKFDGQLYTNNSIFALARSASNTGGEMTVNGAMVAADVGVLVATQLRLHYDSRLKAFLKLKDNSKVVIDEVAWYTE